GQSSSTRFPVQVLDHEVGNSASCTYRAALASYLRDSQLHLVRAPFQRVLLHYPLQGIQEVRRGSKQGPPKNHDRRVQQVDYVRQRYPDVAHCAVENAERQAIILSRRLPNEFDA